MSRECERLLSTPGKAVLVRQGIRMYRHTFVRLLHLKMSFLGSRASFVTYVMMLLVRVEYE
jgi:hypothetical protein